MPGQPVILEVANVSSTSLRVSWNSSGGEIDTFIIFANGAGRPPVPASTDPLVYIIEGLDPFQCVDVQVAASNQAGEGPLSETVVQKTNQASMSNDAPSVAIKQIASNVNALNGIYLHVDAAVMRHVRHPTGGCIIWRFN